MVKVNLELSPIRPRSVCVLLFPERVELPNGIFKVAYPSTNRKIDHAQHANTHY